MKKLISGFFAGMMISIGGAVFLACYEQHKVIGALFFCVGLLTVCWKGFSLYTGKIGGVIENHSKEDISVLLLGLLGNFLALLDVGVERGEHLLQLGRVVGAEVFLGQIALVGDGGGVDGLVQAEHLAVGTYQTLEVDGQTGGEAEYLGTGGQNLFLIARALAAEQAF